MIILAILGALISGAVVAFPIVRITLAGLGTVCTITSGHPAVVLLLAAVLISPGAAVILSLHGRVLFTPLTYA